MARTRVRYTEGPPKNDVYFGMLVVTVLMLAVGCVVLALELNEYEWVDTPPPSPAIALPTLPRPGGAVPATPVDGGVPPAPPMNAGNVPTPPLAAAPDTPVEPVENPPASTSPVIQRTADPQPDRPVAPGFNPAFPRR
jgi:hypothetical protein